MPKIIREKFVSDELPKIMINETKNPFKSIPQELLEKILLFLENKDLSSGKKVCKAWRMTIESEAFIKQEYQFRFNVKYEADSQDFVGNILNQMKRPLSTLALTSHLSNYQVESYEVYEKHSIFNLGRRSGIYLVKKNAKKTFNTVYEFPGAPVTHSFALDKDILYYCTAIGEIKRVNINTLIAAESIMHRSAGTFEEVLFQQNGKIQGLYFTQNTLCVLAQDLLHFYNPMHKTEKKLTVSPYVDVQILKHLLLLKSPDEVQVINVFEGIILLEKKLDEFKIQNIIDVFLGDEFIIIYSKQDADYKLSIYDLQERRFKGTLVFESQISETVVFTDELLGVRKNHLFCIGLNNGSIFFIDLQTVTIQYQVQAKYPSPIKNIVLKEHYLFFLQEEENKIIAWDLELNSEIENFDSSTEHELKKFKLEGDVLIKLEENKTSFNTYVTHIQLFKKFHKGFLQKIPGFKQLFGKKSA